MNTLSLCLVQIGEKGLELVEAYPRSLPDDVYNKLVLKAMPLGANEGEFTTTTIGDYYFSGYVFNIPSKESRDNIASLAAVFDHSVKNPLQLKDVFSYTINELKKNDLVTVSTLKQILPNLYKGINEGQLKIKISSIVTLEFKFETKEAKKDEFDEAINDMRKDMWGR